VPGGKLDNQITINQSQRARRHDQTAIRGLRKDGDRALQLGGVA
jgi:hypothetical protein